MLIGQKFNTEFLSSVFLSMGVTEATFAFSGNISFFTLLLIDCERGHYYFGQVNVVWNVGSFQFIAISEFGVIAVKERKMNASTFSMKKKQI